jgi:hypothetical protein
MAKKPALYHPGSGQVGFNGEDPRIELISLKIEAPSSIPVSKNEIRYVPQQR